MNRGLEQSLAVVSLVLIGTLIFAGVVLSVSSVSADDSHVDDVSIIVPISCNLNSYNTTHSETVNPNTTEEDIGKTTLQAFCNDNDGFAIYAIGYTGNVDGTTTLVGNNTSLTIATSTNTSSSSSWSMKVTKETNTNTAYLPNNMTINNGYDSYSVVPTNWTKVATFSSATDTEEPNGKGAVLYTTYKVHIAPGQAADTYSGKVKYTLFHPSTSCLYYTVHFNPGDGSGYMADQPICNNGSTALSTNTFIPPTGYEFKEWNTAPDGSGTSYTNEQIINTNLADVGESITLYAMWWQKTIANSGYLQEVKACPSSLTTGQVYTIKDSRDEEQYSVAKLADNKCWLLDNLRLDPTSVSLDTLKGKTNASDTTLTYYKNGGGSGAYPASGVSNIWDSTSQNSYVLPYIETSYKNSVASTVYGSGSGKIGIFYNYCAASAGSYCYESDSSVDLAGTLYDIGEDICPTGWHIPTGSDSGEFQALHTAYSSNATQFRNALSTPLSGYYLAAYSVIEGGSKGVFWSSTYYIAADMYRLLVGSSYAYPSESGSHMQFMSRMLGLSVRCVFGDTAGL